MTDYLLFRLYGPLASWGETAVGEVRPTAAWPGRSAILGLLAAALGIRRNDDKGQQDLASALGMAVRVDHMGGLMRDYHTIQVPPQRKGTIHRTRRDEVRNDSLNTLLSQRDYRTDALCTVAVWHRNETPAETLKKWMEALRRPCFNLYLGRKSCPPALPLAAHIVMAPDVRSAFDKAAFPNDALLEVLPPAGERIFVWEEAESAGMEALYVTRRRDEPLSRSRWQFSERDEYYRSEWLVTPSETGQ